MAVSFHLYLKNRKKQNGEYPIYLRITHNRRHKYISTGIAVLEKFWNPAKEEIRRSHDNYKTLNLALREIVKKAEQAQTELSIEGKQSAKAISKRMKAGDKADFFSLADEWYDELVQEGKYHQYKTLKVVLGKIEKFESERYLDLNRIDIPYLEKLEKFIKRSYKNKANTVHKNFKIIRRVVKTALKNGIINEDPFVNFDGAKKGKPSKKTKLSIDQIRDIEALGLEKGSWEWHVRNAFLFSFYSGGIRFGDICCLKWKNVKNVKLSYQMNKNEKAFSTTLNDYQKDILSRYSGDSDEFIFPFLNKHKDYSDSLVLRRDISSKNVLVNGKT